MAIIEHDKLILNIAIFGNEGTIECDVSYCYYDAIPGNEIDPPEPEYVEVRTIIWNGLGMSRLINALDDPETTWSEIADKVLVKKRGY